MLLLPENIGIMLLEEELTWLLWLLLLCGDASWEFFILERFDFPLLLAWKILLFTVLIYYGLEVLCRGWWLVFGLGEIFLFKLLVAAVAYLVVVMLSLFCSIKFYYIGDFLVLLWLPMYYPGGCWYDNLRWW